MGGGRTRAFAALAPLAPIITTVAPRNECQVRALALPKRTVHQQPLALCQPFRSASLPLNSDGGVACCAALAGVDSWVSECILGTPEESLAFCFEANGVETA
eukprot:scaffold255906_cov31-Tisochrysis_lutea.AAC.3